MWFIGIEKHKLVITCLLMSISIQILITFAGAMLSDPNVVSTNREKMALCLEGRIPSD